MSNRERNDGVDAQFRDWWPDAVDRIAESVGRGDALFVLFNQLSRGLVRASNGYLEPLSPRLFPQRLMDELNHYHKRAKEGPLTYRRAWLSPELQTLISWSDLEKLCPPKADGDPETCKLTSPTEATSVEEIIEEAGYSLPSEPPQGPESAKAHAALKKKYGSKIPKRSIQAIANNLPGTPSREAVQRALGLKK